MECLLYLYHIQYPDFYLNWLFVIAIFPESSGFEVVGVTSCLNYLEELVYSFDQIFLISSFHVLELLGIRRKESLQ